MKLNIITSLLVTTSIVLSSGYTGLVAADDDDRYRYPGIPFVIKFLNGKIQQNAAAIDTNRAAIEDLDLRVTDLELAPPGGGSNGERSFVDVDCVADANALLPPQTTFFPANTTYFINGACNGPLVVTEDGVYFEGLSNGAAIVLPGDADPSNGAILGHGSDDLQISNLLIDASAWGTGANAEETGAAGIRANNASVYVTDSRIVGGLRGINPYRNASVHLQGTTEISGFVNSAISVGFQSQVITSGPVSISTDGDDLVAIDVYSVSYMDVDDELSIEIPEFYGYEFERAAAIGVDRQSRMRISDGEGVDIGGLVLVESGSSLTIEGGTITGPLEVVNNSIAEFESVEMVDSEVAVGRSSTLNLEDGSITGSLEISDNSIVSLEYTDLEDSEVAVETNSTLQLESGNIQGDISVETNSILNWNAGEQTDGEVNISENATLSIGWVGLGFINAERGAVLGMEGGSIEGLDMSNNTVVQLEGTGMLGDISLTEPAHLNFPFGNLQGNTIYLCGNTSSTIDQSVRDSGNVLDSCADDL